MIDLANLSKDNIKCLVAINDETWIWHSRLGHINMDSIARLIKKDRLDVYPKLILKRVEFVMHVN